ncbi:hypothetical protein EQM14_01635 [Caproiciproducens sp. NJN-50]|uniref:hypothetical protein n=1 Tax=Caproiciproducens sp. NJN-50 TaxID=2507162 RepID=UPI000FFE29C5|nr:hypothetical protein [Caproiciproducens sp. NJN-50]QAT48585.1 hypothetical protein EQM14_01635 [Caproiciproducens sp. NJN-50]
MNLPIDTIASCKSVMQAQWDDYATVTRDVDVNQSTETQTVYENILCHLSEKSAPVLNTDNAAAMTEPVFTLLVDTAVTLKQSDSITVLHKGQTFTGLAGLPFNRTFSNSVVLSGVKIS